VLNHDRRGTGDPLVLLGGIGMRWQWWAPCLPALEARYDVLATDVSGFGDSAPLDDDPTPPRMADELESWFADLGLDRPHVVGISMGGLLALELARRGSARSATAFSPGGFFSGWHRAFARASLKATYRTSRLLEARWDTLLGPAVARRAAAAQMCQHGDRIPREELAGHFRAVARSDFGRVVDPLVDYDAPAAGRLDVPVTIAWGLHDRLLFPKQALTAAGRYPSARIVPLPGASHIPTYDDPDAVVRVVVETAG
jgi:pimeloyl-ACP methyl ester carboxylesterase